jgi:hypothetical protein
MHDRRQRQMCIRDRVEAAIVYWLFFAGGIENKIHQMVMNKKDYTLNHYKKSLA